MVAERGFPDAEAEAMSFVRADDSKTGPSSCFDVILGSKNVEWKVEGFRIRLFLICKIGFVKKKGVQKSRSCFHRLPYKIKSIYRFPQWGIYRMDKVWRENGSYPSLDLLLCILILINIQVEIKMFLCLNPIQSRSTCRV